MPSEKQAFGYQRERLVARFLEKSGYRIEDRNWRGGGGEVDLIGWDEEVLCFVEVRARSSNACGTPEASVGRTKQRHVAQAAAAYLTRFSPRAMPMARFDVVAVDVGDRPDATQIRLYKNAFEAPA